MLVELKIVKSSIVRNLSVADLKIMLVQFRRGNAIVMFSIHFYVQFRVKIRGLGTGISLTVSQVVE